MQVEMRKIVQDEVCGTKAGIKRQESAEGVRANNWQGDRRKCHPNKSAGETPRQEE